MLDLPNPADLQPTDLITFTVTASGVALGGSYGIIAIEITREVNRIPRATIVLEDGSSADADFAISSETTLVPGVEIAIAGGYGSVETALFKGVITRHRIELGPRRSRLTIEAKDAAFRMALARMSRTFADQSDAEVMQSLIGGWPGLAADVTLPGANLPQIVQHQASDWDFVVMRAEIAGAQVVVTDGTVAVAVPAMAGLAAGRAVFGQGLREAALELDGEAGLRAVEVAAWDPANQDLLTAQAEDSATPGPGDLSAATLAATGAATAGLSHPGARDQAELDGWSAAALARGRRGAMRGTVTVQGTDQVRPGTLLELGGVGKHFTGLALVTGVSHRLGHGDWTTEVMLGGQTRPHAERFPVAAPAAGGQLPPVPGLQIGVVMALENDPVGEGRIQIRLPLITATEGTLWARLARTDAGKDRGFCLLPEINDEVVVGFLDGDPRDPVVLGSLHSSAAPSAVAGSDDNNDKAIVTRGGMRIHWNDDSKTISIDTPAGNALTLDEDGKTVTLIDQSGNKVTLDEGGVLVSSAKDLKLEAKGDVTISGAGIAIKAKGQVKVEGSAGAELSSGGTTVIKGTMVNIN